MGNKASSQGDGSDPDNSIPAVAGAAPTSSQSSPSTSSRPLQHPTQQLRSSSNNDIASEGGSNRSIQSNTSSASAPPTRSNATNSSSSNNNAATAAGGNNQQQSKGYIAMIKDSYQALVHAIIRPPRSQYEAQQLGPNKFNFCGRNFQRTDFILVNERNLNIQCSLWEPVPQERPTEALPCVIYMHGNSSSRLESLSTLSLVLSIGACLLSFDFCGSGRSDGEYVSLGAFEKDDLQCVIKHLREANKTSTIALWGRSMGAATALLHGDRDPSIAGMVLDSAFADLVMLAEEMVERGRQQGLFAPGILVRIAIKFVRSSVQKAAGFDIKALSPIEKADKCFIPALFIAAEHDSFVIPKHSERIYEKYGGDKNIIIVDGDHNTPRPKYLYDSICIFLQSVLQVPDEWMLPEGDQYTKKLPWSYRPSSHSQSKKPSKMSPDELLALQIMEQEGLLNPDQLAELSMQRGVQDSINNAFGGSSSSKSGRSLTSPAGLNTSSTRGAEPVGRSQPPPGKGLRDKLGMPITQPSNELAHNIHNVSRKDNKTDPPSSSSRTPLPPASKPVITPEMVKAVSQAASAANLTMNNNNSNNNNSNNKSSTETLNFDDDSISAEGEYSDPHQQQATYRTSNTNVHTNNTTTMMNNTRPFIRNENGEIFWTCGTCTLLNSVDNEVCEACGIFNP